MDRSRTKLVARCVIGLRAALLVSCPIAVSAVSNQCLRKYQTAVMPAPYDTRPGLGLYWG